MQPNNPVVIKIPCKLYLVKQERPKEIFDHFNQEIRPQLRESPYRILVCKYLSHDLHSLPDNIMVDSHFNAQDTMIEKVQLIDLENAAYLPGGRCIKGMPAGNDNWRSPEAHLKGELNKPTDMFSFGIVCIYAILGRAILGPDKDFRNHESKGVLPALIRLQRQVSYFGDVDGITGFLKHVGDDVISCQLLRMLWDERADENIGYKAFSAWSDVLDSGFKDLIQGLTNLDPAKRLSARQALGHPWFTRI
ncbi:kinase-like domain-containing protein [Aspergillus similis]